jgi:hypothetical protein
MRDQNGQDEPACQHADAQIGMTIPLNRFLTCPVKSFGKPVCRLGLATRGGTGLTADDAERRY